MRLQLQLSTSHLPLQQIMKTMKGHKKLLCPQADVGLTSEKMSTYCLSVDNSIIPCGQNVSSQFFQARISVSRRICDTRCRVVHLEIVSSARKLPFISTVGKEESLKGHEPSTIKPGSSERQPGDTNTGKKKRPIHSIKRYLKNHPQEHTVDIGDGSPGGKAGHSQHLW